MKIVSKWLQSDNLLTWEFCSVGVVLCITTEVHVVMFCCNCYTVIQNNSCLEERKLDVPSCVLLAEFLMDVLILQVFSSLLTLDFASCKPLAVAEQLLTSATLKKKCYIRVCKTSPRIPDIDLSLLVTAYTCKKKPDSPMLNWIIDTRISRCRRVTEKPCVGKTLFPL